MAIESIDHASTDAKGHTYIEGLGFRYVHSDHMYMATT